MERLATHLEDILNKDPILKKKLVEAALGADPETGEINPNFIYEDYTSESDDTDYEPDTEVSESETEDDTVEEDTEHIKQSNIITITTQ